METIFIELTDRMKIAVTDTGKPEKQKQYMDWLQSFDPGAELVIASYRYGVFDLTGFDGVVLTGGEDVDPKLSMATPEELVEQFDRQRDDFEFRMLDTALKMKLPVLGICRGMQVANVFLGGTLVADLSSAGFERHTALKGQPELRHAITVMSGSLIAAVTETLSGVINSYHHQSVRVVADDLIASGYSDDDVVESMEWKEKNDRSFLLLVQWHPERIADKSNPFTGKIGSAFFHEAQNLIQRNTKAQ
jgi:putative glutamine amidotransferase